MAIPNQASAPMDWASDFPSLQLVRTGRWIRIIGRLTLFTLVVSVIAMFFVPWRQTSRGVGIVVALDPQDRPQPVMSPAKGLIKYVKPGLREGSYVERDELLLQLTPFAADGVSQLDLQIAAVKSKKSAADDALQVAKQAEVLQQSSGERTTESLTQVLEAAKRKWEQSKNELSVLEAALQDKENQLRIAEEVSEKGLVSGEELFSKRQDVKGARVKVTKQENAIQEALANLLAKEEEIAAKRHEIDIKNRNASQYVLTALGKLRQIEKELLDLETKRGEFNRLEVRSPRSGFIQQWLGVEGSDTVKVNDQLFVIVPDTDELAVEMRINGNDMPLIHEGDPVRLQFEGWPAVQFVGWPSVAIGTFGGKVNRVSPTDDGKGSFPIVVAPDPENHGKEAWPDRRYLRQGVRANGWVLLNEVSLGYEIWRQLNGFPPVLSDGAPLKSKDDKGGKIKLPK